MFSNLVRAVFVAIPPHLHPLQCVLVVLECFAWFQDETALKHVSHSLLPQHAQYTLVSEAQRCEFPIQRDRGIPDIWGVYSSLSFTNTVPST